MPRRYWSIVLVALALASPFALGQQTEPVDHQAGDQSRAAQTAQNPSTSSKPISPPTIQDLLQRIASALEAANDKPESPQDAEHARRDLAAQEDMAKWAMFMLGVGGAEAVITFLGLLLIWRTLIHTRRAADYAKSMADDSQTTIATTAAANLAAEENTIRELRAYVSVNPAGVKWTADRSAWIGHVKIANVGKVPARNVRTWVDAKIKPIKEVNDFDQPAATQSIGVIQPGVEVIQGSEQFTFAESDFVFVYGVVNYVDGFGQERWTKFCHRYAGLAREVRHGEHEYFGGIDPSIGRQHQWGNDAS